MESTDLFSSFGDLGTGGENRLVAFFWIAAAASLILPRLPFGQFALYPFALLGTWAHEMGHGLAAILVRGSFHKLVLYPNLGGTAFFSGVSRLGKAFVAAAGLLGPAVAGGVIIVLGSRESTVPYILFGVAGTIILSLLYVRGLFGMLAMIAIAAGLAAISVYTVEELRIFVAQLIGVQFCFACWSSLDYMFTKEFRRDGQTISSDTQQIAEVLRLPYWFWGGLIAFTSAVILLASVYFAWIEPFRDPTVVLPG